MIAISHTLNKLATDSEVIVMNAAGLSPIQLFRPFVYATIVVVIMVVSVAVALAGCQPSEAERLYDAAYAKEQEMPLRLTAEPE